MYLLSLHARTGTQVHAGTLVELKFQKKNRDRARAHFSLRGEEKNLQRVNYREVEPTPVLAH